MKALVMKDAYVLWKQMRIFILILAVMALTGGVFNSIFVVIWCSMLPYSALAYDERSHWDQLAAMMPYSRRDIVLSKYVLGWLCMSASVVLSFTVQSAAALAGREGPNAALLLTSLLGGIIALDVTLPALFRFGVERGRMVFLLIVFSVAVLGGAAADLAESSRHVSLLVMAGTPVAAVIATAVSVPLSMKLYRIS